MNDRNPCLPESKPHQQPYSEYFSQQATKTLLEDEVTSLDTVITTIDTVAGFVSKSRREKQALIATEGSKSGDIFDSATETIKDN